MKFGGNVHVCCCSPLFAEDALKAALRGVRAEALMRAERMEEAEKLLPLHGKWAVVEARIRIERGTVALGRIGR